MTHSARFLLPSMANIVFLCIFVPIIFSGNSHILLGDTDTGIHIRAGERILTDFSIPKYDVFSFHSPPLHWTTHEWLSQVIMAVVHRPFGLTGIVIFFSVIIASIYCLLFKTCRISSDNIPLCVLFTLLAAASSILHWLARPHIFSLLFILIFHHILSTYQYRSRNYLGALPVLMLFWVNLHGGFIVGFILIGVFLAGNLVQLPFLPSIQRSPVARKALGLIFVMAVSALVSLLNPKGYHVLTFPFTIVSDRFLMDNVTEFLSPNFHGTVPFRYLLFLTIAIFAVSGSKVDIIELALVILFTHMALYSARYIPLFAIIVSPILIKHAGLWLESSNSGLAAYFRRKAANMALVESSVKGYFWVIVAAVLVSTALIKGGIRFHFDEEISPIGATEFLKNANLQGNMFNDDSFGDYVIYAVWPQYKVFVDGRHEVYGSSRIKEYLKVVLINPDWESVLKTYDINWVFYPANSALSTLLLQRDDWKLIYADKVANIFVRSASKNKAIIDKFKDVKSVPPNGDA